MHKRTILRLPPYLRVREIGILDFRRFRVKRNAVNEQEANVITIVTKHVYPLHLAPTQTIAVRHSFQVLAERQMSINPNIIMNSYIHSGNVQHK